MKTVVHLVPAMDQGGVETVVSDLNRVLVGAGWRSVVISKGGRLVAQLQADGGEHVALDLKSKNPLTYFLRAWKLRGLLRKIRPDVVCAHSRVPAWLFVWANRGLGLKWITYAHGANSVSRYSAVMTKGDRIVVPSKFLADYLSANYPGVDGKIRVIHPSVDFVRFDPANLDRAFVEEKRREWGLTAGTPVVMAVGRLTPVKGLENVIRETPRSSRLVIVGGADRRHREYERKLREMAGDNVVFAGPQEKMPECLSLADEVVSGNVTKPESFGLSVAEALAMNKPVRLLRSFGGAAEILAAAEAAAKPTRREAVRSLCDCDIMCTKTLAVYAELR